MSMRTIIGRESEQQILQSALQTKEAELIAVYGRRRVGKTFLIRSFYEKEMLFDFSGTLNASLHEQLLNFRNTLAALLHTNIVPQKPHNWSEAFSQLINYSEPLLKKNKRVIFFDELPWLSSAKSGFLSAFEFFWNSWATKQENLIVVICGSAASWMIQKIVNNKGGLHNRITRRIRLLPFNLNETEAFLKNNNVQLDHYQITQLYMSMGGIPHYLKEIKPGQSAAQNIDRICFSKDGLLHSEFANLYRSLFNEAEKHMMIVKVLSGKNAGLTRKEIIELCGLSSGGTTTTILDELTESGFITPYVPFNRNSRDSIFKLSDEFSRFHLKFIENNRTTGEGSWMKLSSSQSWKSWSGTAFENICLKHILQIKTALGIAGVYTEESAWRYSGKNNDPGAQIDLLIDRADFCINLCEMKFSASPFSIDKKYASELTNKRNTFIGKTKTTKSIFITIVSTFGLSENIYKTSLIQNEVKLESLFQ